jgi:hypothetical protein
LGKPFPDSLSAKAALSQSIINIQNNGHWGFASPFKFKVP